MRVVEKVHVKVTQSQIKNRKSDDKPKEKRTKNLIHSESVVRVSEEGMSCSGGGGGDDFGS